jgi:glycosyltransferase involved in cell wall biosynthesis
MNEVTVLLGVHNGEKTLDRCLESINNQSEKHWSILVIDDASTDSTAKILQRWQDILGDGIAVLRNDKNLGLTKSLNRGLMQISTPYTARIDADDWWHSDKLKQQLEFLKQHPDYGVIGCVYQNVGLQGKKSVILPKTNDEIKRSIIRRNPFAHSCVVFRTEIINSLGGYDEQVRFGQDYDLWLRCMPLTKCYNLPELLCWRSVGSGISVERQRQQMIQCIRTQIKYIRKYKLPIISYLVLIEPMVVILTPAWLRGLKRKFIS